jgi:hypothetical protein
MAYPYEITKEVLDSMSGVSDEVIKADITDEENEIELLRLAADGYGLIAKAKFGSPEGKMAAFYANASVNQLFAKSDFVRFLRLLLEARNDVSGNA